MISLESLRHFVAVVENQGVNRAAEKIALSPSSLTRSIQGIEDLLGKPVFDRVGRKVVVNSAGQELYARAKPLLRDFAEVLRRPSGHELVGHYSIGASHFLCKTLVAKRLARFAHKYPRATFTLNSLDTSALVAKLHRGEIDLGVAISPRPSETLTRTRLATGALYLCAGKRSGLDKLEFSKLRTTLNQTAAIMHRASDSVDRCDNHPMFKAHGLRPKIHLFWDDDDVAVEMLGSGPYWTLLPDIVLAANPSVRKLAHPVKWRAPYEICTLRNKHRTSGDLEALLGFAVDDTSTKA